MSLAVGGIAGVARQADLVHVGGRGRLLIGMHAAYVVAMACALLQAGRCSDLG